MAVRGSQAKEEITRKILEQFPNSFTYDKEIRIPVLENGETVQIKVTLTAAKVNVVNGADTEVPSGIVPSAPASSQITEAEKKEVADLLASLNL